MGAVDKTLLPLRLRLRLFLSFKWEDNEKEIERQGRVKCKDGAGDRRMIPHLNNQIWIRTGAVGADTNLVLHIVYLHIYKIHKSIQNKHANNLLTGRKPKCDPPREAGRFVVVASSCRGKKNNSFVLLEIVLGYLSSMWRPLGQLWSA